MTKVGIIVNVTKDVDLKVTSSLINWLKKRSCEVLVSEIVSSQLSSYELGHSQSDIFKLSHFIIVLGGDGTLLGVARQAACSEKPILGINMGHLGFITEVEIEEAYSALERVLNNEYTIENRMMLEAEVIRKEKGLETFYCLNDIGISKGILSRIITLKTYIDNNYVDTYNADGLLISTPTGSTAYSLSAGGPIISPGVSVILITPICPHSLSSRSLVVSQDETIRVEVLDYNQEVYLTADGQQGLLLHSGDRVIIKKAPYTARLIKVCKRSFYDVLRTKLKERVL